MNEPNQFELLKQKRFAPFFWTQFLGAFNDNVYKYAFIILVAFQSLSYMKMNASMLANISGVIFILPFLLFSATAGQLADKYEKSKLIRNIKLLEITIMVIGAFAFFKQDVGLMLFMLFMLGVQATLFGPVKYSILPQQLKEEELVGGNGLVEMGTFIAILLGTILGGVLIADRQHGTQAVGVVMIACAVMGWLMSRGIPLSPASDPTLRINWNPFTEAWTNFNFAREKRTVFLSLLGISWFWFYGATFLTQFPNYCKDILHANEHVATLLLAVMSVGIGVGSLLCERLSGGKIEIGLVPFGSIGLTLFAADLFFAQPPVHSGELLSIGVFLKESNSWRVIVDLLLMGMFGGFYSVPLYALIQNRSEPQHRARIIAANNIFNAIFLILSGALAIGLLALGLTIPQIFLVTALLNALVAIYIYKLVPEFLMRFIVWLLIHSIYRLEKTGLEHIPDRGAAVLVCNHVSFVDALIIGGACRRPVRFVMDHNIFKVPVLNFVFRTGRTIPIASFKESPEVLERAYEEIANGLNAGDVICIFPEGKLTADGDISPFKPGISRIIERTPVPVIPMALRGLWGSFFSRFGGKAMTNLARCKPFAKIGLAVAEPIAPKDVTPENLQQQVLQLRGDWR